MQPRDGFAFDRTLGKEFLSLAEYVESLFNIETDGLRKQKLCGFLVLTATTAIEVHMKEILEDFASQRHQLFATYVSTTLAKTNAKVRKDDLLELASRFGDSKKLWLKSKLKRAQNLGMRRNISISDRHDNLLTWRNSFAHEGIVPCTFDEAVSSIRSACFMLRLFKLSLDK